MAEDKKPTTETNATTAVTKEAADSIEQVDQTLAPTTSDTKGASGTQPDEKSAEDKKTPATRRRSSKSRGSSRRNTRPERAPQEFEQRIIGIRRVTRVVSGGRRFSFSVAMVVGDRKGRVGVGLGKSTDTALAIDKAVRDAKKNMVKVTFSEGNSVPHELRAKFKASIVEIRPAPGRGLVAGSSVRDVLDLAGAQNVSAKLLSRSKNKINNARCAIQALAPISARTKVSLANERDNNRRGGGGRSGGGSRRPNSAGSSNTNSSTTKTS